MLFSTLISIAKPFSLSDSRCFSSGPSFISHQGYVLNSISINDSIFWQSSFIFSLSQYYAKDILYTLSLFQHFKASIPITFLSIDLAARIITWKWFLTIFFAFHISMSNAKIALDCKYPILLNCVYAGILVFCNFLFKTSIKSAFDFWNDIDLWQNIILFFLDSNFRGFNTTFFYFCFLLVISVLLFLVTLFVEQELAIWA